MKRKFILVFMILAAMGMTACSMEPKEDAVSVNTDSRQETAQEESAETETTDTKMTEVKTTEAKTTDTKTTETKTNEAETSRPEIVEDNGTEDLENVDVEDIPEGDPIAGIVEEYEGNTITVRTPEDDMLYRFSTEKVPILKGFSTESAQAAEGDFQIAAGDKVEVSYRGLLDDKEHPIEAVKIVVITVE